MLENPWQPTKQLSPSFLVIIAIGGTQAAGDQYAATNCLWGGGSCFLSAENGEYSWVCYIRCNLFQWISKHWDVWFTFLTFFVF